MDKVRIHEIAKELGKKSKEVVEMAQEMGLSVKSPSSAVTTQEAENLMNFALTGTLPPLSSTKREVSKPARAEAPKKSDTLPEESVKAEKTPREIVEEPQTKKEEKSAEKPAQKAVPERPVAEAECREEPLPKKTAPEVAKPSQQEAEPPKVPEAQEPKAAKREAAPETSEPQRASTKEEKKEKPTRESLAKDSVNRRRGIFIVKKKRPKKVEKTAKEKIKSLPDAKRIIAEADAALTAKKSKRKAKKSGAERKETGVKLDLLSDRRMGGISVDYTIEEVVLPDFTEELNRLDQPSTEELIKRDNERKAAKKQAKRRPARTTSTPANVSRGVPKKRKKRGEKEIVEVGAVEIPEDVRVYEFAEKVGASVGEVIKVLFGLGKMVTKNDFLEKDEIEILAEEFDVEVVTINPLDDLDYVSAYDDAVDEAVALRPPVITIMGHVDHGKTSLLDRIRQSKVAEKEAGGITQHVGAYQVEKNGKKITFIDTPGHEAFTEMRARGAQTTDVAIIVVAADDGAKPQTIEAINHAKAAEVPMIIAVNKIDKPEANPDMVKSQLSELGIMPVEWGGEIEFVEVSAKSGEGIEELLETILLQAEIMELEANPDRKAKAVVVESTLEKGRGPVATVVVKNGTMRVGDNIVCGNTFGRVRTILSDTGKNVKSIGPGDPGVVVGLNEVPGAGEIMVAMENDKEAREIAGKRHDYERQKELSKSTKVTLDELSGKIAEGQIKALPVIVKADVQGSLEAIKGSLEKLKNDEVKINVIHSGIGGITESDVALASASEDAMILGFNVRPTGSIKEKAKQLGVEIKTYSVIYDLIDDMTALLSGMMSPVISEEGIGQAEIRDTFVVAKVGTIAGCMVTDGVIRRNAKVRLIRDGIVVRDAHISSLRRFKDDVKEVGKGYECGMMLENYNDVKVGDVIEAYEEKEEQVTL